MNTKHTHFSLNQAYQVQQSWTDTKIVVYPETKKTVLSSIKILLNDLYVYTCMYDIVCVCVCVH